MGVSGQAVEQESMPHCLHVFTDKIDNRVKEKVSTWSTRRPRKHKTIEGPTYWLLPSVGVLFCAAKEEESSKSKSEIKSEKAYLHSKQQWKKQAKINLQKNTAHKTTIILTQEGSIPLMELGPLVENETFRFRSLGTRCCCAPLGFPCRLQVDSESTM